MSETIVRQTIAVPLDDILIVEEGFNSRREKITPGSVRELQEDMAVNGLDQPVHLQPLPYDHPSGKKYKVMAGFRRTLSAKWLNWKTIPAFVREDIRDETEARVFNIRENLQRKNLSLIDEAYAIKPFLDIGASPRWIAEKIGMSKRWVEQRITVGKLPDAIQDQVAAYPTFFKQGHIEKLAELPLEKAMEYVNQIKTHAQKGEVLPVRGKHKTSINDVRKRSVSEINELLEAIYDSFGPGIETRLLAWAAGNISNFDILKDLNAVAADRDKIFIPPENLSAV